MRAKRIAAIARFEFLAVVKRWSYLLATFGLPLFLAGVSGTVLGVQTYFLTQRAAESSSFALVDEARVLDRGRFEDEDGRLVRTDRGNQILLFDDAVEATSLLENGDVRAVYVIEPDYLDTGNVRSIESQKTPLLSMRGTSVEPLLRSLLQQSLLDGRVDTQVRERVLAPANFVRSRLGPDGVEAEDLDQALDLLMRTTIPLFLGVLLLTLRKHGQQATESVLRCLAEPS